MNEPSSTSLRRTRDALLDLQSAFDSFMELHTEASISDPGLGYLPTCWPKDDADPDEVARRTTGSSQMRV